MPPARILVADDEPNLRRVLVTLLRRDGHEVVQASNGAEAIMLLGGDIDVVITDLRMPEADGMEVLRNASRSFPQVPVIMITAYGSVGQAVEAIKAGAFDYIEKPFEQDVIRTIVEKAVGQAAANKQAPRSTLYTDGDSPSGEHGRYGLVGQSAEMHTIFEVIEKVADSPSTVLITGESGTGKELVAKALHENSSRKNAPFIKINCAAIPKTLMESELFGYEKGAFTGATSSKPGRFELADGGSLFLDEIGEIPVEMQVKLLRAIQESEFERVGGIKTLKVDVRLITATNRDLEQEIARGNFREDLYYRLNVVPLQIPPLRRRRGDIPFLVRHIVRKFNERLKKNVAGLSDDALAVLESHSWPGNIRELENVLERTILFCKNERIERQDLPPELTAHAPEPGAAAGTPGHGGHASHASHASQAGHASHSNHSNHANQAGHGPHAGNGHSAAPQAAASTGGSGATAAPAGHAGHAGPGAEAQRPPSSPPVPTAIEDDDSDGAPDAMSGAELSGDTSLKDIVRAETSRVERELIVKALDETSGNVTQAARLLKISRKSLQMKMKEFGLRDREG